MKACIRVVLYSLMAMTLWVDVSPVFAIEVGGEITTDTVWALRLSPYTVTADITVPDGVTLEIEQGVVVQFANASSSSEGYSIIVEGTLTAIGAENAPIVFTSEDTERYWEYIEFAETSVPWDETAGTGSILDHCIVEYGGNGSDGPFGQAAILGTSSGVTIKNSIIRYSESNGILCHGSVSDITGNRIHNTGTGIVLMEPLAANITNNYLIENTQGISVDSAAYGLDISGNTVVATSDESYGACLLFNLLFHDRLESYAWKKISGPGSDDILDDSTAIYPVLTVPSLNANEQLVFQLTVTNIEGLVGVDTVTVNATWENQAPVADAGEDQEVIEGEQVNLDAFNSYDNDGDIVSWKWTQTSSDPKMALSPSDTTNPVSFTAPFVTENDDRTLVFQVDVTDNGGLTSSDTVNIRILDSTDYPDPIADAGTTINRTEGQTVTLQGNLGNPVGDNITVVSWFWRRTEGDYVALSDAASQNPTFQVDAVDANGKSYTFELEVIDDKGQTSTDTVIVNVLDSAGNTEPTAQVDPVGPINEGEEVILDATGSLGEVGETLTYSWEQVSGPTMESLSNTGTDGEKKFKAPNVTEDGTYVYRVTVTDGGDLRDSAEVSVDVHWINEEAVPNAGNPQTVQEGSRVQLDASGSTDDQGIIGYQWTQTSGTAVTLIHGDAEKCYFTAPQVDDEENLVFKLTVKDEDRDLNEFEYSDNVVITVIPINEDPVAEAGTALVAAYGSEVTLDGSGSQDPDAVPPDTGITSYLWEQIGGQHVKLNNPDTATPYFTAPAQGDEDYLTLTFQLTVKGELLPDGGEQSGIDTVVVNVTSDASGTPPVAVAGPDQTAREGDVVTLTAAGSYNPGGMPELTVTGNRFSVDDENGTANALAVTETEDSNTDLSVTGNTFEKIQGNYLVYLYGFIDRDTSLTMTDNAWGETTADGIAALIYDQADDDLLPPVTYDPFVASVDNTGATVAYPPMATVEDDMTVDPDDPVTLDGTGTYDPDSLFSYQWDQTGGKTVTLSNASTSIATFNTPAITDEDEEEDNVLTFKLTVSDSSGFSDSREIQVTINTEDDEDAETFSSSGCFIGVGIGHDTF